jgi:hypothetical protein
MVYLTAAECLAWCVEKELHVPWRTKGADTMPRARFDLPGTIESALAVSRQIAEAIGPWRACLLWVTAWDIRRSSENLHLYYTLRRSYGDRRLIPDAPGHLFLSHENHDLVSFVELALLFGWDAYVLTDSKYGKAFISHDSWVEVWRTTTSDLEVVSEDFRSSRQQGREPFGRG